MSKKRIPTPVQGGGFYQRDASGFTPVPDPARAPDGWICRRVADFPHGRLPVGAATAVCRQCAAPIAFNPARVDIPATVPKICMQCAAIQPLPIEEDGT